uniref:SERPIN domain-containing protein n=1 Tax=Rhabditophanes sp. KR3021 TaxID=114890 RepID=A0AC35TFV7_9BILA
MSSFTDSQILEALWNNPSLLEQVRETLLPQPSSSNILSQNIPSHHSLPTVPASVPLTRTKEEFLLFAQEAYKNVDSEVQFKSQFIVGMKTEKFCKDVFLYVPDQTNYANPLGYVFTKKYVFYLPINSKK